MRAILIARRGETARELIESWRLENSAAPTRIGAAARRPGGPAAPGGPARPRYFGVSEAGIQKPPSSGGVIPSAFGSTFVQPATVSSR